MMLHPPHYQKLAQLFGDSKVSITEKNKLVRELFEQTDIPLVDLFRFAPPQIFLHYIERFLLLYSRKKRIEGQVVELKAFWEYIVTVTIPDADSGNKQRLVHQPDKLSELLQRSFFSIYQFIGLEDLKVVMHLFSDLKVLPRTLFMMYFRTEDKQKFKALREFLAQMGALKHVDYLMVVKELLKEASQPIVYNHLFLQRSSAVAQTFDLKQLVGNQHGLAFAIESLLDERCDQELVQLYSSLLLKMALANSDADFLWETLQVTILYIKMADLRYLFPTLFEKLQPLMLRRLFLQGLFRRRFVCCSFLLQNLETLYETLIKELPTKLKDTTAETLQFKDAITQMLLVLVAEVMEQPNSRKADYSSLIEIISNYLQKLLQGCVDSKKLYMFRDWRVLSLKALEPNLIEIKPSSCLSIHNERIHDLMTLLECACSTYQLERVYLCLLALKDCLQPLKILEDGRASTLFGLINQALDVCQRYTPSYKNYEPLVIAEGVYRLCCWLLDYSNVPSFKSVRSEQKLNLQAFVEVGLTYPQIIYNVLQEVSSRIEDRRYVYPIACMYQVWKLEECNNADVKFPKCEYAKHEEYNQSKFNLTNWVVWAYHRYNLHGLERLLLLMASASHDESLVVIVIPMIVLLIETTISSELTTTAKKKKPLQFNVADVLRHLFDKYIFENRMERIPKAGFLNLPEVLFLWQDNEEVSGLRNKVFELFGKLNKLSLSDSFASIGIYKAAIRYLEHHIALIRDVQKNPVPIDLYWKLYCYEVQLDSNLRQVSFDVIATTLKVAKDSEFNRKDLLIEEDAVLIEDIIKLLIEWTTRIIETKDNCPQEKSFFKFVNKKSYRLCHRISSVKEPYEKKIKYQMLLLIRHIVKIVDLCRIQIKSPGKSCEMPSNCGLSAKQYQLLQKQSKPVLEPIKQLEKSLTIMIDLELADTFRAKLLNVILELVGGQLRDCFKNSKQYQRIESNIEHKIYRYMVDRRILSLPKLDQQSEQRDDKNRIRWHFYENDSMRVSNLCEQRIFGPIAKEQKHEDIIEFTYYFFTSKFNLLLCNANPDRIIERISNEATFSTSEAEYLCLLLNEIYLKHCITIGQFKSFMNIGRKWIYQCKVLGRMELAQDIMLELTKILLEKFSDEEINAIVGKGSGDIMSKVFASSFLYYGNQDLLKGLVIEILIGKVDAQEPLKASLILLLLTMAADKNPGESIWWVARLAHYCDTNKKFSDDMLKKLFNETDRRLDQFGKKLYDQIKGKVPDGVIGFLQHIYLVMGLGQFTLQTEKGRKSHSLMFKKEPLKLPFVQPTTVIEVFDKPAKGPESKCETMFLEIRCINPETKKEYMSKLILKMEFKETNRGIESLAAQMFRSLIPVDLGISYSIIRISKYAIIVEFLDNFRTMKEIIYETQENLSASQQAVLHEQLEDLKSIKSTPAMFPEIYRKHYLNAVPSSQYMFKPLDQLDQWWEARVTYVRCTAIWAMLGYIFGLGDRHTANIMVQPSTGKVVHIDYEMMLDLGRNLKFAQYVPFRMTPNIEAPMGAFGPFGLFFLYCMQEIQRLQQLSNTIVNWTQALPLRSVNLVDVTKSIEFIRGRLHFSGPKKSVENSLFDLIKSARDNTVLQNMYLGWNALE